MVKIYKTTTTKKSLRDLGALIAFGKKGPERIQAGSCPRCGTFPIHLEDFRDDKSRREWGITALCQACQDTLFVSPQE